MMKRLALIPMVTLSLMFFNIVTGQVRSLTIDAKNPLYEIPDNLWGLFFEDINLAADGGIYAELVKNRSFEFYNPMMGWKEIEENSVGTSQILNRTGSENPRYIRIQKVSGTGRFGISNEGFRRMYLKKDETYRFSVLARCPAGNPPLLYIELTDSTGKVTGKASVTGLTSEWRLYENFISSSASVSGATLRVMIADAGIAEMDMISLFPVNTWKGRKNGLRADLVQMLADLKPGFLRFPGGCIVEGHELDTRYQWKKSVGPAENRHQIVNRWNTEFSYRSTPDYYQSFGLGFYEYFQLCEDIGAQPLPILNCGMACQYNTGELVPPEDLGPYIDDFLDLIEFANGPSTSEWGRLRAEMGHPAPFGLKYIGIGNEQWGPQYVERLKLISDAIRIVHPGIELVGGAGPASEGEQFDYLWKEMKDLKVDFVDEHYYRPPGWFLQNASRYDNYSRGGPRVFAGEYAAHSQKQNTQPESRNNWEAALAEAAFLTGIERNSDVVQLASYAPLFGHTDGWQWRPDLIWFDNHRCVATPNYWVQKMYSTHKGDRVLKCFSEGKPLTGQDSLYASAVIDNHLGEVILKMANVASKTATFQLEIAGKNIDKKPAVMTSLHHNNPAAFNSLDQPETIVPYEKNITLSGKKILLTLEGRSFSVLRIPVKQ